MMLSRRIRLYPTREQSVQMFQFAGVSRFAWNESLSFWRKTYEETGKSPSEKDMRHHLVELSKREGFEWIAECPEAARKRAVSELANAYKAAFKKVHGFPRFHSKRKRRPSFFQRTDRSLVVGPHHVRLTNIRKPVFVKKTKLPEKMYNAHVTFDGKYWYLSYSYDTEVTERTESQGVVGIDLGVKDMACTSDGAVYGNPNNLDSVKRLERRKRFLQRRLMRKPTANQASGCSNNVFKLRRKIANIDRRIANIRQDARHNMTKELATTYSEVHMEDLNVRGMLRNRHLAKSVSGVGFREIRRQLEYKTQMYGSSLVVVDRFFPSSQTCSHCGERNVGVRGFKKLRVREWTCPTCGTRHHRDINAARNIASWNPA